METLETRKNKVIFTPKNDEEREWVVCQTIYEPSAIENTPNSLFLYTNGVVRQSKSCYTHLTPIDTTQRIFQRGIIYALRRYNDGQLMKPISIFDIWCEIAEDRERIKRAILKFWSLREYDTNRVAFSEHYEKLMAWKGKEWTWYLKSFDKLGVYRILDIEHGSRLQHGTRMQIVLTDFGREIVKLHRDKHYLF